MTNKMDFCALHERGHGSFHVLLSFTLIMKILFYYYFRRDKPQLALFHKFRNRWVLCNRGVKMDRNLSFWLMKKPINYLNVIQKRHFGIEFIQKTTITIHSHAHTQLNVRFNIIKNSCSSQFVTTYRKVFVDMTRKLSQNEHTHTHEN